MIKLMLTDSKKETSDNESSQNEVNKINKESESEESEDEDEDKNIKCINDYGEIYFCEPGINVII